MKVIIAGSRSLSDIRLVERAVKESGFTITRVISGGAPGVDQAGLRWASGVGLAVDIYLADWKSNGKVGGIMRNAQMADEADALIAIWDGKSKGTKHMIKIAAASQLPVYVLVAKPWNTGTWRYQPDRALDKSSKSAQEKLGIRPIIVED